ncbi:MAG: hypothetical protein DMG06_03000 [Acidobacteria bacterium]|nr:MAG: hypothetical protein DMG06_03000 [Acidobacteriota bacterium]
MLNRRNCVRLLALGIPAWRIPGIAALVRFPTIRAPKVELAFRTPGPQPNGLPANRDGLWILDQKTNRVALVHFENGRVIREFKTETDAGSGITFDGSALWIASTYNCLLLKVDAQTGKTLHSFPTPGAGVVKWGSRDEHSKPTGAHGLEYWRGEIWVAVPPSATVYVMNPENGSVLRSFPAPGVRPHGLGWDPDGSLWCTESNYRSFFKMSPKNGHIQKQVMLPPTAPEVNGTVVVPHGMTVWERQIWFCVAESGEVYRFPIPS